jgi:hypothetical protein
LYLISRGADLLEIVKKSKGINLNYKRTIVLLNKVMLSVLVVVIEEDLVE